MKPVNYQRMPSTLSGGYPSLDGVLSIPNVMHCEKCGFASTDAAVFKKHMNEHTGTRFYCFYCNNVSFTEAELNAHLKQHTEKYPFKCPHCGQGYMRWLCLVKHIDRLHSNGINYGRAKPDTAKIPQVPVSSALPSVPTVELTSPRPVVRVTVPTSSAPAFRLGKDEQRVKTLDTSVSNATNGNAELLSPLNGLIQHNRALTVSLPEEVTIPAGCLVEFVEVKTVNGTKELKLRLISQQENESVIKDTRTGVSQNTAPRKQLPSTLNHLNTVKSMSLGMCTINKKPYQAKTVNVEHPAVFPVNTSKNQPKPTNNNKITLKRINQEIINLECQTVIPSKVPKTINPVREASSGIKVTQREPVNHNAAPSTVTLTRVVNRLTSSLPLQKMGAAMSQRAVDERKNVTPEQCKAVPLRRVSNLKSIPPDMSLSVKTEPGENHLKNNTPPSNVPLPAASQMRPPVVSLCKDLTKQSFCVPRTLSETSSFNIPVLSNRTNSKIPAWNREVKSDKRAGEVVVQEPKAFPVISSVFSLSQQPEDSQSSIQPLVMALRGIVMDKGISSVCAPRDHVKTTSSPEQVKKTPALGNCTQGATQAGSTTHDVSLTEQTSETVKVEEHQKGSQEPPALTTSDVKMEKICTSPTDNNKCSHTPDIKTLEDEKPVSKVTAVDACGLAEPTQQINSETDMSSKYLTVSLKRVQLGVWKKNKKGLKLRISKCKTQVSMGALTDCTVIYPMPLKMDQLVKQPGPNQPVVVLNHPKPRTSMQGARAETLADTGASEAVPKCQILKMRLSKVMGQKYEVMGCTVRVSP